MLETYHIEPKKGLGQNFLHDPNALQKIADSAGIGPQDTVVEIGPGTGALTDVLAQQAARVIAVELDNRLQPLLEARFAHIPNVEFVYADILQTKVGLLTGGNPYLVVANVPYYITGAIMRHLFESDPRPTRMVLTMQLEVAQKLVAKPGDLSLIAVSAQFYAKPRIVAKFPPAVFYPRPEVGSAVVRFDVYPTPPVEVPDEAAFFTVVRAGFSQKRKQIKNALAGGLMRSAEDTAAMCARAGIDPQRRAETLTLAEWGALTRAYGEGPEVG
ncbi:MAG TPA: 16S rRNA (adenine(1518)-N(6)/adenine(1519)-N(6))-dimethyltransferase RsmA [Candidatus Limnocylindrales bacterium]|nr:16S rRNA (adenine(1518)-N(6)/adenine(1519)-N(6))-dimethyltransferase RsmA [Candidatus Limnocylindrales bacterium]